MTGFGRAELASKIGKLTVEAASVNSRYLEISVRSTRTLSPLEPQVREKVSSAVVRGKVNLFIGLEQTDDQPDRYLINEAAARSYTRQLRKLQKELKLDGDLSIRDLLLLPDVARPDRDEFDLKEAWVAVEKVLDKALIGLATMRAKEGKALAKDMGARLKAMAATIRKVEKLTTSSVKVYAEKLNHRIEELLGNTKRDSDRLEEEIAIFADRTDITEECIRFKSHIDQFTETLSQNGANGRKLNFIIQEMNREANTIGSKCADFNISSEVISLKEEIEKLREQVQNVE